METKLRSMHPMPDIASFVARLKAAFGEDVIDAAIRRGKAGEPTFHATENGHCVGTASPVSQQIWEVDDSLLDRHYCPGCDGSCVGTDHRCRQARASTRGWTPASHP